MTTLRRCLVLVVEVDVPEGKVMAQIAADALEWYADAMRKELLGREDMERTLVLQGGHNVTVKTVHGASNLYTEVNAKGVT